MAQRRTKKSLAVIEDGYWVIRIPVAQRYIVATAAEILRGSPSHIGYQVEDGRIPLGKHSTPEMPIDHDVLASIIEERRRRYARSQLKTLVQAKVDILLGIHR